MLAGSSESDGQGDRRIHKPLSNRRVLVVEDEYFIADEIRLGLVDLGAEVLGPFADVQHAAVFLGDGTPIDVALLDINVRSEMVFPLARALRSRGIPVVFTTGYGKAAIAPEFQEIELWQKPLDLPTALPRLAGLVRQGGNKNR